MTLTLHEEEVDQYFALKEEYSDLLSKVSELTSRLISAQHRIGHLEDQLAGTCTSSTEEDEEHY